MARSASRFGQTSVLRPAAPQRRRGAVVVLIAILMVPMVAMVAFAIDYGFLLSVESDLQRAADTAALAAVQDLIPDATGYQDLPAVRSSLRSYVTSNVDPSFVVLDADIEIGRYDPATIYSNVTLLNVGVFDAVRVTLRRDATANTPVSLFFAGVLGIQDSDVTVTATAVLQKAAYLPPGADILPFAVEDDLWDAQGIGDEWSIYGGGNVTDDQGNPVPGNWGTVDIGPTSNSSSDLNDQIIDGLRQSDINALNSDSRISTTTHVDAADTIWMQADTGLSAGLQQGVEAVHGETRIVPIYDSNNGQGGNNLELHIVRWGIATVVDSHWQGNNKHVTIAKSYAYMGELIPHPDLGTWSGTIEAAFTAPVLVE